MKKFLSPEEKIAYKNSQTELEMQGMECYTSAVSMGHYSIGDNGEVYCKGQRCIFASEDEYNNFILDFNKKDWLN